jgi:hypothetical protein
MRWDPILFDLAVVIIMWMVILVFTRQRRLRVATDPSPKTDAGLSSAQCRSDLCRGGRHMFHRLVRQ